MRKPTGNWYKKAHGANRASQKIELIFSPRDLRIKMLVISSAVRTIKTVAAAIENQAVFGQFKPQSLGDDPLSPFDFLIAEFLNPAAIQTKHVIVVSALIDFKHRLATFKVIAFHQPGCFKLSQHPVHGRQSNFLAGTAQRLENRLSGQVGARLLLQNVEDFHTRQGDLQAGLLEFF